MLTSSTDETTQDSDALPEPSAGHVNDTVTDGVEDDAANRDGLDRNTLRDEAVRYFSKDAEYSAKHHSLCLAVGNLTAEKLLKPIIAEQTGTLSRTLCPSKAVYGIDTAIGPTPIGHLH